MKRSTRILSPAGFLLALLLFLLLPFVSVSCEAPMIGSAEASYNGATLIGNGKPSVDSTGLMADQSGPLKSVQSGDDDTPATDVSVLAIISAVLIAAGAATALLPRARVRFLSAGVVALLAGAGLVTLQLITRSHLSSSLREAAGKDLNELPEELNFMKGIRLEDLVHTKIGFWLAIIVLGALAAGNIAIVLLGKTTPAPDGGFAALATPDGPPPEPAPDDALWRRPHSPPVDPPAP